MIDLLPLAALAQDPRPASRVGRKAAGLAELMRIGATVPAGFVLPVGTDPNDPGFAAALAEGMSVLERETGRRFGGGPRALLVAVRSGAAVSMPGMLDTVLDVGVTPAALAALAAESGEAFAASTRLRALEGYGRDVAGLPDRAIALARAQACARHGLASGASLDAHPAAAGDASDALERSLHEAGWVLPADAHAQLEVAVRAVFASWSAPRAVRYRRHQGVAEASGTACLVQAMVFGNRDARSCAGVLTTRDPRTGAPGVRGEYAPRAQGPDVVDGRSQPLPLTTAAASDEGRDPSRALQLVEPEAFAALVQMAARAERHFADALELEFVVDAGEVHALQARPAKRTLEAGVRIARALVEEGLCAPSAALSTLDPGGFAQAYRARLPPLDELARRGIAPIARGLAVGGGAAVGALAVDVAGAVRWVQSGVDVILARPDTRPDDVHGMKLAAGLLTSAGGATSHAATVARGLGKPCVTGCLSMTLSPDHDGVAFDGFSGPTRVRVGEPITIDGDTGYVYAGALPIERTARVEGLSEVLGWADEARRLRVMGICDTLPRALATLRSDVDGIGLFTDRLLHDPALADAARILLVADPEGPEAREAEEALVDGLRVRLRPVVDALAGRPLVVRAFDDVLPDLLALDADGVARLAAASGESRRDTDRRLRELRPTHRRLGLRGARLGLVCAALPAALVRALVAAVDGSGSELEVVVPAVTSGRELRKVVELVVRCLGDRVARVPRLGAVVGFPHACLEAGDIATAARSIYFDTHELTRTMFGMSWEDSRRYLTRYVHELGVYDADPFVRFDETGVGRMIRTGTEAARAARPAVRLGLAGEVAGEPSAVRLAHELGFALIACPPERVAVARIAAGQAASRRAD